MILAFEKRALELFKTDKILAILALRKDLFYSRRTNKSISFLYWQNNATIATEIVSLVCYFSHLSSQFEIIGP